MEVLAEDFGDVVDKLADEQLDGKLPESVISCYNDIFGDGADGDDAPEKEIKEIEDPDKEEAAPKKEKASPEKKEKASPEKKEKKKASPAKMKPRSCYGHIASAKSGQLDELLKEGATYAELMEACDVKLHRVKGHIGVLKNKGLTVLVKEDKDKPEETHVKIKESSV